MRPVLILATSIIGLSASGALAQQRTIINPVDIDYRYNFEQINDGASYRTGADPAVVNHKGAYYLFLTLADGYWRSTDLIHWNFIVPSRWPMQSIVAPAVWSDGKEIVIEPSMMEPGAILSSSAPETGKLDFWVLDTERLNLHLAVFRRPTRSALCVARLRHQLHRQSDAHTRGRVNNDGPTELVFMQLSGNEQICALCRRENSGDLGSRSFLVVLDRRYERIIAVD